MNMKFIISDFLAKIISTLLPRRILKSQRYFRLWENRGYHITPVHFHQPVPDTRTLNDDLWSKHSELLGIHINEKKQLELLSLFVSQFKNEYDSFPQNKTSLAHEYFVNNGMFESVDGEILYCMIRYLKPSKILEIGSGYSTYLSAQAVLRNRQEDDSYKCELVAIDPYPNEILESGFPGLSRLIRKEVQDIPVSEFKSLSDNDILFIDSSHVLKIGGDVQYEYLEILPRLNKGVTVHVHDIFLPAEYPKEWIMKSHKFWNEQYLLQAFLLFNGSFEVLWAGSYMHLHHHDKLEGSFGSYRRDNSWPGSFWMRRAR